MAEDIVGFLGLQGTQGGVWRVGSGGSLVQNGEQCGAEISG